MMTLKDGRKFNDMAAFEACKKVEAQFIQAHSFKSVAWDNVYASEQELLDDLKKVYIPKGRGPLGNCFQGYAYIYSFAYYVQQGWGLSAKQLTQAKRLALEIKKAVTAAQYITEG